MLHLITLKHATRVAYTTK